MTTSAIVFDLDGTLVDSLSDIAGAMNVVLAELGLPTHSERLYARWVGEGVDRLVERASPPGHRELSAELHRRFRDRYARCLLEKTALYPGVAELLDELARRHIPAAILSNKPHDLTVRTVESILGCWHFAAVAGHHQGMPKKPDPAVALGLAADLGVTPGLCAFVGDTQTDIETAIAAEMIPVGVAWGFRDRSELERAGARHILEEPVELLAELAADRL